MAHCYGKSQESFTSAARRAFPRFVSRAFPLDRSPLERYVHSPRRGRLISGYKRGARWLYGDKKFYAFLRIDEDGAPWSIVFESIDGEGKEGGEEGHLRNKWCWKFQTLAVDIVSWYIYADNIDAENLIG